MSSYRMWQNGKITAVQAMNKAGVSKSTWYRKIKEIEKNK